MTTISSQRRAADNVPLAVVAIVAAVLALSLGDAAIKRLSADLPLWQVFVLRSVLAAPLLVAVIRIRPRPLALRPRQLAWTAVRSLLLVAMWLAYYAALPKVALSVAAATYYTAPLFIALLAAALLGDRVGRCGWAGVALGFLGVLLMLQPRAGDFTAYALLPLLSALLYASAMLLTRTKCRTEEPLVLSLGLHLAFIVVGAVATLAVALWRPPEAALEAAPFLLAPWQAMGATEWLAMGLLAAAALVGSVGAAVAYQVGPPSVVATFDFAYLAFAALWGVLFFAELPDAAAVCGMALIVAAGLLAIRR